MWNDATKVLLTSGFAKNHVCVKPHDLKHLQRKVVDHREGAQRARNSSGFYQQNRIDLVLKTCQKKTLNAQIYKLDLVY